MKLSKTKLSQIIREEFEKALKETISPTSSAYKALEKHTDEQLGAYIKRLQQQKTAFEKTKTDPKATFPAADMLAAASTVQLGRSGASARDVEKVEKSRKSGSRPGYDLKRLEELIKKALEEGFVKA